MTQLRLTNSMDRALWAAEGGLRVIDAALRVHLDRTTAWSVEMFGQR